MVPQPVAQLSVLQIGAVGPVILTDSIQIVLQLRAGDPQQRPNDLPAHRSDPAESIERGSAQQVQKHRLSIVIRMVCSGNFAGGSLPQRAVTQLPRSLFNGKLICFTVRSNINSPNRQRDSQSFAEPPTESLVPIPLFSPKLMVDVTGCQGQEIAGRQFPHHIKQGDRVRPAGKPDGDTVALLEHPMLFHKRNDPINHRVQTPGW